MLCLFQFVILSVVVYGQTSWEVDLIDQGKVRGYRDHSGDFYSFLDVPYATTPTGSKKFKGPLPPPSWSGTFDAVRRDIVCTQAFRNGPFPTQDDCLVANILVPNTEASNLPVMVYIHGGGYLFGKSGIQFTDLVRRKRFILVTFNYRLGIQGFLCLGTEDVPGNAGMKDQVALLRWVKKNIASFGGNPDDVTIEGCSAGGSSASLLTMSPMASGLFNKAIISSGSALSYTGPMVDPIHNAKTYAQKLNFSNIDDIWALEEFYKTTPNEKLNLNILDQFDNTVILFAPCIERDTGTGEEIFLSESPWSLISRGEFVNIPLLYGYAEMEGIFHIILFNQYDEDIEGMSRNFSHYLPMDLQFKSDGERDSVADSVRKYYFGDKVDHDSVLSYVMYYTDYMFAVPMLTELRLRRNARNDTVYMYEYEYVDEDSPLLPNTKIRAADHCSQSNIVNNDIVYYKPPSSSLVNKTPKYMQMQDILRNIWINFVETGKPVPETDTSLPAWLPLQEEWSPHMAFRYNDSSMREALTAEGRARFWEPIYEKHYREPIPPPTPGKAAGLHSSLLSIALLVPLIYGLISS